MFRCLSFSVLSLILPCSLLPFTAELPASTHILTSLSSQPTAARLIKVALSKVTSGPFPPLLWPELSTPVVYTVFYTPSHSFHPWHPLFPKVSCQNNHFCCWFLGTSWFFSLLCLSEGPPFPPALLSLHPLRGPVHPLLFLCLNCQNCIFSSILHIANYVPNISIINMYCSYFHKTTHTKT